MNTDASTVQIQDVQGIFDDPKYARMAQELSPTYRGAAPFPHIVIDDFIDPAIARGLSAAVPGPDDIDWVYRDNENNRRRYQHDETKVPPLLRAMLRELNSRQFVLFLEELTGIESLIPDPYFIGGGVHISGQGDFLKIHADFNWHHKLQAYRRVNALLYLTDEWYPEWEGAIEFWDREMTRPVASALPLFNRLVVFSTGEHSNHGPRVPNACPPDKYRKVLNLYYYTSRREDGDMDDPHFTLYKPEASEFAMQLRADYRNSANG
jgi:Rps23 Pro-64 3,4-dihydroxylase Tpa1-like proline 4-hydroxylase